MTFCEHLAGFFFLLSAELTKNISNKPKLKKDEKGINLLQRQLIILYTNDPHLLVLWH